MTARFAFLLCLPAACSAAVPLNDRFAARAALAGAAIVSAAGNNMDATLEADENDLDSTGGASVWWKWTAPASGWVSIDTSGSAIDTVLAVLTDGPSLDDAYVVGYNDESGDPAATPGSSRVVFQATAGTEYHVAVHGFLGEEGNIALRIQPVVQPALQITSLTMSPGAVNVTATSQTVTADVGISSAAGFAEGVLALHRAGSTGLSEIPLLPAHRISGTATAGVYSVTFSVPRYSAPGTWLLEAALSDTAGQEAVFGRGVSAAFEYDHVLPAGLPAILTVTNTGAVDSAEPALASYSISPAVVNVAVNPALLTFTFRLTDALSGFGSATLTLFTPGGEALTVLSTTAAQRTSGTALDGTYTLTFSLPARMPGGEWSTSLLVRDAAGNPALYDNAVNGELFPAGTAGTISVSGAPHSYWAWMYPRSSTTPGALPNDDADGDGTSNLLEFAFGLTVDQNDSAGAELQPGLESAGLPAFSAGPQGLVLSYTRRRASSLSGISYTAQFGAGLDAWTSAAGGIITPLNDLYEQVTVQDPAPGPRRFGRLRVTLAE